MPAGMRCVASCAGPAGAWPAIRMSGRPARPLPADGGPAAQQGEPPPMPAHQGGAVYELMGLASHSTSTSSRASFSKTRQSATSASLS